MQPRPIGRAHRNTKENTGGLLPSAQVWQKFGLRLQEQPAREDRYPAVLPSGEGQEQGDEPEDLRRDQLLQGTQVRATRQEALLGVVRYFKKR